MVVMFGKTILTTELNCVFTIHKKIRIRKKIHIIFKIRSVCLQLSHLGLFSDYKSLQFPEWTEDRLRSDTQSSALTHASLLAYLLDDFWMNVSSRKMQNSFHRIISKRNHTRLSVQHTVSLKVSFSKIGNIG